MGKGGPGVSLPIRGNPEQGRGCEGDSALLPHRPVLIKPRGRIDPSLSGGVIPMPARPLRPCTTPGCPGRADTGRCPHCRTGRQHNPRTKVETSADRGYSATWRARRRDYLTTHPVCALCGRMATIPDHYPMPRRQLVAAQVADPDADEHLRPLCDNCHRRQTGLRQPGGWWRNEMP